MKIIAVGLNYLAHNKEFDNTLKLSQEPVIFMKPDSSLLKNGKPFFIPDFSQQVDYEAEVVVRIMRMGKSIPARFASRYYDAFTVGIDFTARDLQQQYRRAGLPWELSKGFDGAATLGNFVEAHSFPNVQDIDFSLSIDGETVQQGSTGDMLFGIDRLVAYVSTFCTLKTGDLIYTGTPAGVGPVHPGQHLQGYLAGEMVLDFYVR